MSNNGTTNVDDAAPAPPAPASRSEMMTTTRISAAASPTAHATGFSTSSTASESNNQMKFPNQTLSILSNTIIHLPPRTIGGIRDQILKAKRCNCKKSGCLKLYCECFNAGIVCNEACLCEKCHNVQYQYSSAIANTKEAKAAGGETSTTNQDKDLRLTTIQATLERNPDAFRPKAFSITNSQRGQEAKGELPSNSIELELHEKRAKKTKMGCNCRKSACLKKYCECFQAQLYCMATCRCQNCQNTVGNEKREKLVQKLKKKGEEKESLALAAFAISSGSAGGSTVDYAEVPDVTSIGGVDANTVAMVSAGVAASGVDVFLPASSYARQMKDENGKVVNEIAFGVVGRQTVGGKEGDKGRSDGLIGTSNDKSSYSRNNRDASLKRDHDDRSKSLLEDIKMYREQLVASAKGIDSKTFEAAKSLQENTSIKKQKHEEFALATISKITQELTGFKAKMDSAIVEAREKIEDKLSKQEAMDTDQGQGHSSKSETMPESTQVLPDSKNIKELYAIASQDIALYNSLSDAIRERAVQLAKARQKENGVQV